MGTLRLGRAAVATALVVLAASGTARAQAAPAVTLWNLNAYDILYVLSGGGSNAVALMRDEGVVLIDPLPAGLGKASLEAIATVSDQPVRTIINLRSGAADLKANLEYPDVTKVLAPKAVMDRAATLGLFTGATAKFAPSVLLTDRMTLLDGPDVAEVLLAGPGRTDGDAVVFFKEKRLAYMGDLFPKKAVPVVEASAGGSLLGLAQTLAQVRTVVTTARSAVPGRESPRGGAAGANKPLSIMPISLTAQWKDVEEYADFVSAFVDAGKAALAAGKTPALAAEGLALPERFKSYDLSGAAAAFAVLSAELKSR